MTEHHPIISRIRAIGFIENRENTWIDTLLSILLIVSLVGFLSIKSATNICFFSLFGLAILFTKRSASYIVENNILNPIWPIVITLTLPVLAIFISQLARQEWILRSYDSPSRMLFSISLLFYFIYKRINFSYLIGICSPIALWATAFIVYAHPEVLEREGGRLATYFLRPNSLGLYSLVLTSFCLFHLDASLKSSKIWFFFQLSGILVGSYLILGSETRSSWICATVILMLWFALNYRNINFKFTLLSLLLLTFLIPVTFHAFPNTGARFSQGVHQLADWYYQDNADSSPGIRLAMWKISWKLFLHKPVFGYGDLGYVPYLAQPEIKSIATDRVISVIACCGPHNEFLTNTLRSGILGSISVLCLFGVPFVYFLKNVRHDDPDIKKAAQLGLAYIVCLAINSISIEVFGLKFTSSFYGLVIAGLIAQIISQQTYRRFTA